MTTAAGSFFALAGNSLFAGIRERLVSLCHLGRLFSQGKLHLRLASCRNCHRLAPDYRLGKHGTLHPHLRHDVVQRALADHSGRCKYLELGMG